MTQFTSMVGRRTLHDSNMQMQLIYNTNARINILSMTAGSKEYISSAQFIGDSVTTLPKTP